MTDLTNTILAKSDQLTADDLANGREITIKITKVSGVAGEQPIMINYEGDGGKPYMPGKSMRRVLAHIWGVQGNAYVGRQLTLYRDDKVKFGGLEVGGIRISHASHITAPVTMALTASKANKKPFTVKPLTASKEPDVPAELKAAGDRAASEGVAAYTAFKDSLSAEDKAKIKPLHSGWSKDAIAADANKPQVETEEEDEEGPPL